MQVLQLDICERMDHAQCNIANRTGTGLSRGSLPTCPSEAAPSAHQLLAEGSLAQPPAARILL